MELGQVRGGAHGCAVEEDGGPAGSPTLPSPRGGGRKIPGNRGRSCRLQDSRNDIADAAACGGDQYRTINEGLAGLVAPQPNGFRETWNLDFELHAASRMATTTWPPAAQIEMSPRPEPFSARSFASVATIRPPVAAKGCPTASEEPLTLSFDRSIGPSGLSRQSRSLQYLASSQALSVARTVEANASWISWKCQSCSVSLFRSSRRAPAAGGSRRRPSAASTMSTHA